VGNGALFTPLSTGNYTVIGRAVNGCTNSAISTILVNPVPTVQAHSTSSVICNGASTTLYGSGATTYSWSGGVSNNTAFTPSVTGTYTVSGSTPGCTGTYTAATSVTVNPLPLITVSTSSAVICATQSATLTITGTGATYSLNGVSSGTSAVVSPTINTTYTISAVSAQGCQASKTFTQGVSPCSGVHELTAAEAVSVKAYPNPASGYFNLKSGKDETVVIVNEFGQVVSTLELRADTETPVSGLASGMYFVVSQGFSIKIAVLNN
ncbi:MAG: T9SS type A sorting domain-containing protein, partial [Mucilaginibacter sp.]